MRGWMGLTRFSLPFENAMHEWGLLIGVYGVCEYFRLVIIPMHFPYIFGPFSQLSGVLALRLWCIHEWSRMSGS